MKRINKLTVTYFCLLIKFLLEKSIKLKKEDIKKTKFENRWYDKIIHKLTEMGYFDHV